MVPVAIRMQIAVRLDAGFDNPLQLVGIFLNLFDARDQTRVRIQRESSCPSKHSLARIHNAPTAQAAALREPVKPPRVVFNDFFMLRGGDAAAAFQGRERIQLR